LSRPTGAIFAPPPRSWIAHNRATGMPVAGGCYPLDVSPRPVLDPVAPAKIGRREDVALLAVDVVQEGDPGSAVGVVLNVRPSPVRRPCPPAGSRSAGTPACDRCPGLIVTRPWLLRPPLLRRYGDSPAHA
jgi:hypothetical protein